MVDWGSGTTVWSTTWIILRPVNHFLGWISHEVAFLLQGEHLLLFLHNNCRHEQSPRLMTTVIMRHGYRLLVPGGRRRIISVDSQNRRGRDKSQILCRVVGATSRYASLERCTPVKHLESSNRRSRLHVYRRRVFKAFNCKRPAVGRTRHAH